MLVLVDESGHSADTASASDHFVLSGVAVRNSNVQYVIPFLDQLRADINRQGQEIHWNKVDSHPQRLHLAQMVGRAKWLRTINVVVCKRDLPASEMDAHERYRWTLRLLLERVSWLARDEAKERAHVLVSRMGYLEPATVAEYERVLQSMPEVRIAWEWLDPAGCEVVSHADREELQLADIVASVAGCAFEPDRYGNTERRYLRELRAPMWDHGGGPLTTYGLKFHPAKALDRAAYKWVRSL
jgi:hypothetical protein